MMNLSDTVDLMQCDNYEEGLNAEYLQTKIRYEKLKNFCNRIEAAQMACLDEPKHDCPIDLLREQQRIMGNLLHVLELRAVIEGIALN